MKCAGTTIHPRILCHEKHKFCSIGFYWSKWENLFLHILVNRRKLSNCLDREQVSKGPKQQIKQRGT